MLSIEGMFRVALRSLLSTIVRFGQGVNDHAAQLVYQSGYLPYWAAYFFAFTKATSVLFVPFSVYFAEPIVGGSVPSVSLVTLAIVLSWYTFEAWVEETFKRTHATIMGHLLIWFELVLCIAQGQDLRLRLGVLLMHYVSWFAPMWYGWRIHALWNVCAVLVAFYPPW